MSTISKKRFLRAGELKWLKEAYFNKPEQTLRLSKGDLLMREGEPNRRLFLILQGTLCAYLNAENGHPFELFRAEPDTFVGVTSFFSHHLTSYTTLIAESDTLLAYIDDHQERIADPEDRSFDEQFMPVVMDVMMERQLLAQEAAASRHKALKQLLKQEKMATLGQLSAGIAHELNNAISVIARRSQWLSEELLTYITAHETNQPTALFRRGLEQGREFSSEELRQRRRALENEHGLSPGLARRWAETGLSEDDIVHMSQQTSALSLPTYWEWGAAFHDLLTASHHSAHVVGAIKQLGVIHRQGSDTTSLQETLKEALILIQNQLRNVEVTLDLKPVPDVAGNRGDFIQVWLNLLKNACESMREGNTPFPQLQLKVQQLGPLAEVKIIDNGPGIPKTLLPRIFEPHFTTKTHGPQVGLGLGLAIVQQIVENGEGELEVYSEPGETTFVVRLPIVRKD